MQEIADDLSIGRATAYRFLGIANQVANKISEVNINSKITE